MLFEFLPSFLDVPIVTTFYLFDFFMARRSLYCKSNLLGVIIKPALLSVTDVVFYGPVFAAVDFKKSVFFYCYEEAGAAFYLLPVTCFDSSVTVM